MKYSTSGLAFYLALLVLFQHLWTSEGASSMHSSDDGTNIAQDDTGGMNVTQEMLVGSVDISKSCAAALLSGSGALGAAAAALIVYSALPLLGFGAAGVERGSFAAWWQSTMPLVAKGSLFASLQSVAMTGGAVAGAAAGSAVIGGALGGAVGAAHLKDFCTYVDQVEPNSVVGQALSANLKFVQLTSRGVKNASKTLRPHLHQVVKEAREKYGQGVAYAEPYLDQAKVIAKDRAKVIAQQAKDYPYQEKANKLAGKWKRFKSHFGGGNEWNAEYIESLFPGAIYRDHE